MPVFTNKRGLPDPLFQLLGRESYSRGASRRSATQLIDSPRAVALKERHGHEAVIDVSDRIWAMFGTAFHKLVEDGLQYSDWVITEERIFTEVGGWTISGAVDLQHHKHGYELLDWKVTGVWSVKGPKGTDPDDAKVEWTNQLNLLAYLIEREKGHKITGLKIGAFLRDWKRSDAERDPAYPQSPVVMVPLPLWSFEEREAYVHERVQLHQEAEMALQLGDEPAPCTDEEMWVRGEQWAVWRPGNKRASKVCDDLAEAKTFAAAIPSATIEHRPGRRLRCESYCEAKAFCSLAKDL